MTASGLTLQNSAIFLRSPTGNVAVRTAKQNVGLNADRAQLLDRMLRRLGLQFARRRDVGHQRQVNEDGRPARQLVAELADRLEERQAFDVADRAADLDQHEIDVLIARQDEVLDRVGNVRNDLHGAAEDNRRGAPWRGCPDRCGPS